MTKLTTTICEKIEMWGQILERKGIMPQAYIKRMIGALLGIMIAVLIIIIGFWRTLLITLLAAAGWWLTGPRTIPQPVKDVFARLLHIH